MSNTLLFIRAINTSTEDELYAGMVPNLYFNAIMAVVFGILLIYNVLITITHRQYWFGICFTILGIMETAGFIARCISHDDLDNKSLFILQYSCLTLAPVFTMAGIYYQLSKLTVIYGTHLARLKPIKYSYLFIVLDIIAFFVQSGGGGIASSADTTKEEKLGVYIFLGGLGFQVFGMTVFFVFWADFLYSVYVRAKRQHPNVRNIDDLYNPNFRHIRNRVVFKYFNLLITILVICVYVRCVYRVAEMSQGWHGSISKNETYFIVLDLLMISIATAIFVPFHPGLVLDGRNTTIDVKNPGSTTPQGRVEMTNRSDESVSSTEEFAYRSKV